MKTRNPHYQQSIIAIFAQAPFVASLGAELVDCGPGWCRSQLTITSNHWQQGGFIHAGVQSTLADHTCGAAATTVLQPNQFVLTAEFKLNLLRAATGEKLLCHAQVLKAGRSLVFTEAEVFAISGQTQTLVSKLSATMSIQTAESAQNPFRTTPL